MNDPSLLFLALLTSAVASLAVLQVLSQPLLKVLGRICPDEQAAHFWLSYTRIMLVIAPLLLVLMVDALKWFSDPMDSLRLTLIAILGGLLIGMRAIGNRIGRFITTPQRPGSPS